MKASNLKQLVSLLSPCLGDGQVIPALANIGFDNQGMFAFNDVVATRYKWDHGLPSFGVNGKKLATLLSGWGEKELELTTVKESGQLRLAIRSGKSLTKLPAWESTSFVSEGVKLTQAVPAMITEPERLEETLISVATSAERPVYKSVILAVKGGEHVLKAYASDGQTLIHAGVGTLMIRAQEDQSWIVPSLAVKQTLALRPGGKGTDTKIKLQLGKTSYLAKTDKAVVISKLITDTQPPNFEKPLQGETIIELDGGWKKTNLQEALETASVIYNEGEKGLCHFSIEDGAISIKAQSDGGSEFRDKIELPKMPRKKLLEFYANPDNLLQAFHFSSLNDESPLVLQDKAAIFGDTKGFLYGAAFQQVKKEAE